MKVFTFFYQLFRLIFYGSEHELKNNLTPIELWVKALRSGDYKHTEGHLVDKNGYCCLGVACDVYIKHSGDKVSKFIKTGLAPGFHLNNDYNNLTLPTVVRDWFGLEERNPNVRVEDYGLKTLVPIPKVTTLSNLNDNTAAEGQTIFNEIANIIESQLQKPKI